MLSDLIADDSQLYPASGGMGQQRTHQSPCGDFGRGKNEAVCVLVSRKQWAQYSAKSRVGQVLVSSVS